ncbi:MAG TPA: DUF1385 domain-containing protein [Actinobacteria bacterium]|nr:DUF1385 domain-containing protein [Actinomycetota bacterium]
MSDSKKRICDIGGQAVMEGVMMRSRNFWSIAVRKPDNTISTNVYKAEPISKKHRWLGWPFIRGVVSLVESMAIGFRALNYSINESTEEEIKFSKKEMTISVIIAVLFTVGVFFILPTVIGRSFQSRIENSFLFNLVEGLIRIVFFITYILIISLLKDIRRIFQYHGAEHKTIAAFEHNEELIPEKINKYTTMHMRCGTNFLLIVMFVAVFVFAILGKPPVYLRIISRVLLIPVIAGISYEFIKIAGRYSDNKFVRIFFYPGLLLQKFTTREPDDRQIEVAVASFKKVLEAESGLKNSKCDTES